MFYLQTLLAVMGLADVAFSILDAKYTRTVPCFATYVVRMLLKEPISFVLL